MPAPKKEPLWVQPFLAALGSCGNVTRAAGLAGVDVSGAYNRRNRYPEFRAAWVRVLSEREARAAGPSPGSPSASPSSPSRGEEMAGPACDGVKVSRLARERWSKEKEEKFLEELTVCANVALAAAAVGISASAVYKRKLRDRHFADGWDAAIAVGRARLEAHLLDAADRALDPDALPIAEGTPKVTVAEALGILKHQPAGSKPGSGGRRRRGDGYMDWVTDDDVDMMEQAEKARASIHDKLARLLEQDNERRLAAGYTLHGEDWIPPGWIRAEP